MLYYECHITTEPVFGERLALLTQIAQHHGFKVAKLLMEKGPSTRDTFCTGHGKTFRSLRARMLACDSAMRTAGFKVWRRKIEVVVLDERFPRD